MNYLLAMPVFNEERYVVAVLDEVRRYASDILVIDDGSTDATLGLLAEQPDIATVTHPENRGYGQSLIDAFAHAVEREYDWLITMDCDLQHEPCRIPAFVEAARADSADIVSGSRYLVSGPDNDMPPADRRRINHIMTELINDLLVLGITDAFCGFKAYRVESLSRLSPTIPGYSMPLQLWVQAARAGLRVLEIPVKLIYNDPTRHFGGMLDDDRARLLHYIEVLVGAMGDETDSALPPAPPRRCCRC